MPSFLSPYLHTFHIPIPHLQSQTVNKGNTYLKLRHLHLQHLNSTQLTVTQASQNHLKTPSVSSPTRCANTTTTTRTATLPQISHLPRSPNLSTMRHA